MKDWKEVWSVTKQAIQFCIVAALGTALLAFFAWVGWKMSGASLFPEVTYGNIYGGMLAVGVAGRGVAKLVMEGQDE